jgi:hypothetical protein
MSHHESRRIVRCNSKGLEDTTWTTPLYQHVIFNKNTRRWARTLSKMQRKWEDPNPQRCAAGSLSATAYDRLQATSSKGLLKPRHA